MESVRRELLNYMAEHGFIMKNGQIRITPLFFKIDQRTAISIESSRRDLSNRWSLKRAWYLTASGQDPGISPRYGKTKLSRSLF